jgi:hypothetical protein
VRRTIVPRSREVRLEVPLRFADADGPARHALVFGG